MGVEVLLCHFSNEKTSTEKLGQLPMIMDLRSGRARIRLPAADPEPSLHQAAHPPE